MSQIEKLYEKISRRPTPSDIRFDEIDKVLKHYGFECRQPSKGGTHYIYTHQELDKYQITIPKKNPVGAPYVRNAVKAIDMIIEIRD